MPWETEPEFNQAQAAVMAQHLGMEKKVKSNGSDFIKQTNAIKISKIDRLGVIPGVSYVTPIEEKLAGENPPQIYLQSKMILDIADAVSRSSRNGKFRIAGVVSDKGKYLIDREDNRSFLVTLKPDAEIGKVLKEALEG